MAGKPTSSTVRIWADFNGLFGNVLCLSHKDTSTDENGHEVLLAEGMRITAFMEDVDQDGNRDDLVASGIVQRSPEWISCHGSKWALLINENGINHDSDLGNKKMLF